MCLTYNVQSFGGLSSLNRRKREEIHDRKRRHCILIETSITRIPERLEEIDFNLFVCLNTITQNFEVHSLANRGSTYCFAVPYKEIIRQMDRELETMLSRLVTV